LFALLVNDDDDIRRDRSVRDVVAVLSIEDDAAAIIVRLLCRRCPISIVIPLTFPSPVEGVTAAERLCCSKNASPSSTPTPCKEGRAMYRDGGLHDVRRGRPSPTAVVVAVGGETILLLYDEPITFTLLARLVFIGICYL
jgi:hypothetical protein